MKTPSTRREFLANVGRGMLVTTVGYEAATGLGLASVLADEAPAPLAFGSLEPLVCLLQETPAARLIPVLAAQLQAGTELRRLVAAGALANARTFGGEDYVGFHTVMALAPAYHMSQEMPDNSKALPVFKVLYRNTSRIQEHGGRRGEVLHQPPAGRSEGASAAQLREAVRNKDVDAAESKFASIACGSAEDAFNQLLYAVQDAAEVHRVVLPYRAWDLLEIIGKEHAHTLLRQSVRYCVKAESWQRTPEMEGCRSVLAKMLEEHHLLERAPGDRNPDDAWVDQFSQMLFKSTPAEAAATSAAALAEGISPAAVGEALTLAANQLILRDYGRTPQTEVAGKPI
jgi:hypothetical protein